ncbi:GntR family transcriptional regulator, partial [Acinetobacter baumannii]
MLARGGGVTVWRQIAEAMEADIVGGGLPPGSRMPTEAALSARFGVNRHTVRQALKSLVEKGLVRV